jgi:transcriptional regulator with XRE-family HTH domain
MKKLQQFLERTTTPKMTQLEVAEKLGVSPSLVSLWMSGKRMPGRSKIKKLAELTGIKVEEFL